jgi:hypothetical protein
MQAASTLSAEVGVGLSKMVLLVRVLDGDDKRPLLQARVSNL